MTKVFLTESVLNIMTGQIATGGYAMIQGEVFRSKFTEVGLEVMEKEVLQDTLKSILIYRPLKNALTLGIYDWFYGSENEAESQNLEQ